MPPVIATEQYVWFDLVVKLDLGAPAMTTQLSISPTVDPDHDRIQSIQGVPGWSENLVLTIHDPAAEVSLWAHWGRIPSSPEVWEGVLCVYLPGGELLVSRSFGTSPDARLATSGALGFRCVEPGRVWEMGFDGMARATTTAEVARGPLVDGEVERVRASLAFTGVTPLWSAHGAMDEQTWANAHLEQGGRIEGVLELRGRRIAIDAFASRDHSYGPRDYSGLLGDTWCTALFPSGRAFLTIDVWQLQGPSLRKGFIRDGTEMVEAVAAEPARLAAFDGSPHAFDLDIVVAAGDIERVHVEQQHCMMWTMAEPSALIPGASADDPRIYATEGPALITWDGEVGAGWIEKTLRFRS
jgi:hypothetical protein